MTRDVSLLRDVTATAMLPLIASNAVLVGMFLVMLWLNWKLTLVALAAVPMFWLTTIRLGKRIRDTARRQREREGAMATTASEALGAISVIKSMGLEERFSTAFNLRNAASQKEDLKASRLSVQLGRTVDVLLAISTAFVIWIGGTMAIRGQMTAGEVIVFLTYLKRSFKPAQEFAKYTARLAKAAAAGERVIEILETKPTIRDRKDAIQAPTFQGGIRLDNVAFSFHPEQPILDQVDLDIQPGELVALVGPSGGGKTTILNHVLRLFDPDSGAVTIDGHDLRTLKIDSVRRQTSSVMQDAILLADSVRENIACARPDATRDEVIEAARLANAHAFIMQLPHGYDLSLIHI